jgi:hypothetical protein
MGAEGDFGYWQVFGEMDIRWGQNLSTWFNIIYGDGPLIADQTLDIGVTQWFAPGGGYNCYPCKERLGVGINYERAYLGIGEPINAWNGFIALQLPIN